MLGVYLITYEPHCTCYATEDTVRIVNFFIYNPNHTSLQSLTVIYYAVTRLHNLQTLTRS
jgi:hypothetical protein